MLISALGLYAAGEGDFNFSVGALNRSLALVKLNLDWVGVIEEVIFKAPMTSACW